MKRNQHNKQTPCQSNSKVLNTSYKSRQSLRTAIKAGPGPNPGDEDGGVHK